MSKVSNYSANPDNSTEWYKNIKLAEWKTAKPLQVGSQIAFKAAFLGKELAYTYEIIEFVPEQKLVMKTAKGSFPMKKTYTWQTDGEGRTMMTLRNAGQPKYFQDYLNPLWP